MKSTFSLSNRIDFIKNYLRLLHANINIFTKLVIIRIVKISIRPYVDTMRRRRRRRKWVNLSDFHACVRINTNIWTWYSMINVSKYWRTFFFLSSFAFFTLTDRSKEIGLKWTRDLFDIVLLAKRICLIDVKITANSSHYLSRSFFVRVHTHYRNLTCNSINSTYISSISDRFSSVLCLIIFIWFNTHTHTNRLWSITRFFANFYQHTLIVASIYLCTEEKKAYQTNTETFYTWHWIHAKKNPPTSRRSLEM